MNAGKTRTLLRLSMPAEPKKDGRRGSHAQPGPLTSEDAAMLATATGAHSLPANVGTTDVQPSDKAHGAHPGPISKMVTRLAPTTEKYT